MSNLQAQVRRLQASSLAAAELAEARTRLTEYARENNDLPDREATALKANYSLRHQVGELNMERSHLITEVTGVEARVRVLSSEVAATVADCDRLWLQLSVRVSREAKIRQMFPGWSNE